MTRFPKLSRRKLWLAIRVTVSKLLGERKGEQGVARGVPPPGIFPADLDGRFQNQFYIVSER